MKGIPCCLLLMTIAVVLVATPAIADTVVSKVGQVVGGAGQVVELDILTVDGVKKYVAIKVTSPNAGTQSKRLTRYEWSEAVAVMNRAYVRRSKVAMGDHVMLGDADKPVHAAIAHMRLPSGREALVGLAYQDDKGVPSGFLLEDTSKEFGAFVDLVRKLNARL